ncbi:hypothetical protein NL676_024694 [Syzygium grande]|nr:hypothetical protein NL676_024694 [Syzygium grande]
MPACRIGVEYGTHRSRLFRHRVSRIGNGSAENVVGIGILNVPIADADSPRQLSNCKCRQKVQAGRDGGGDHLIGRGPKSGLLSFVTKKSAKA